MNNLIPISPQETAMQETVLSVAGQLAPLSRRAYASDAKHFANWLTINALSFQTATYDDLVAYRSYLAEKYARATANRMFTTTRRLYDEAVKRKVLQENPAAMVKGFKSGSSESPRRALTKTEARELLEKIDRSTPSGARDYALIMLMLRTGIRCAECSAAVSGDFSKSQGHNILTIQHGKGDKRRIVKIPVDVARAIDDYLAAIGRKRPKPNMPIFVNIDRHGKISESAISNDGIAYIVRTRAESIGIDDLTPHGLRATFVTLALEAGAALHQVQYAAGHSDPRTTERYQKRKTNLDDNAVDFIKL